MSLGKVLLALDFCDLTYSECLAALLTSPEFINKPGGASDILHTLSLAQATRAETTKWALSIAEETYQSQMALPLTSNFITDWALMYVARFGKYNGINNDVYGYLIGVPQTLP